MDDQHLKNICPLYLCFIEREPPTEADKQVLAKFQYKGRCAQNAVKERIKSQVEKDPVMSTQKGEGSIEIFCGSDSLLMRRKRSISRVIHVKFHVSNQAALENVRADPVGVLKHLKDELDNKLVPGLISNMTQRTDWSFLHKNLEKLISVAPQGKSEESCGGTGYAKTNFIRFNKGIMDKCGR